MKQWKVTYRLSINEYTGSQKQQVEKENNKVYVSYNTSYQKAKCYEEVESNLPSNH